MALNPGESVSPLIGCSFNARSRTEPGFLVRLTAPAPGFLGYLAAADLIDRAELPWSLASRLRRAPKPASHSDLDKPPRARTALRVCNKRTS